MRILLDTHVFLWFISADARLPITHRIAIQDPANQVFLSVASVWEAVIKNQRGHLPLPAPPSSYLPQLRQTHGLTSLTIDEGAMSALANLPAHHRDPFDRLIVAQAIQHSLILATLDTQLSAYPIQILPVV